MIHITMFSIFNKKITIVVVSKKIKKNNEHDRYLMSYYGLHKS